MITCKNNFSETVKIATGNYARTIRAAVAWFCMVKELLEKFHKPCWKGPTMKFFYRTLVNRFCITKKDILVRIQILG